MLAQFHSPTYLGLVLSMGDRMESMISAKAEEAFK